jgi:DNA-binding beta-propeller fold protein YncE
LTSPPARFAHRQPLPIPERRRARFDSPSAPFGAGDGQFNTVPSVAVGPGGALYVTDLLNHRIQKFDRSGTFLLAWGGAGTGDGQFSLPASVTAAPSGDVYVADRFNHRIQKFTSAGEFVTTWGAPGSLPGQFAEPRDMAVAPDGTVYVADSSTTACRHSVRYRLAETGG